MDVKSCFVLRLLASHRFVGFVAGLLFLAGLSAFAVQSGKAAQPVPVKRALPQVRVGDRLMEFATIERAAQHCAEHLADLSLHDCIDRYFIVRWLLDRRAEEQHLAERPSLAMAQADLLHLALVDRLRADIPRPSNESIQKYINAQPRDFNKPLRIRIFRLLVSSENEAKQILTEVKMPLDLPQFRALCRKYSIDKATLERGGDLGFVWPDGSTDVPQVSVQPNLYEAALKLKDGELLAEPVAEDQRFAIVWRRGSLPMSISTDHERERVSALLSEQALEQEISTLLADLEKAQVKQRADILLGRLRRKNTQLFVEP